MWPNRVGTDIASPRELPKPLPPRLELGPRAATEGMMIALSPNAGDSITLV
jgi:hypothetical protein